MPVDVTTDIEIAQPREKVAAFASDPTNAPKWYVNIKSVEWKSQPTLAVGARVAFVAFFLGRRLEYTYEITDYAPNERLVMRTSEGPFPMETTYTWSTLSEGRTHMALSNRGEPAGFTKLAAPLLAASMRKANRKDLERLKTVLEAPLPPIR